MTTKAEVFKTVTPELLTEARNTLISEGKLEGIDADHSLFNKGVWFGMEILGLAIANSGTKLSSE